MRRPGPLHRLWRAERGLGSVLLASLTAPLAAIYGNGVRVRNLLYDLGVLRSADPPLPVISIGNLAVGGTGKTPVAGWLVREMERRDLKPALVVRGYGEDEILLHRRWSPATPVVVSRRRLSGVQEAQRLGRRVAVLDDGFQHRQMRRVVEVVLVSPAHPLPPRLLPRGPFREPLRALRRADLVLVTSKGTREREFALRLAAELRRSRGLPPVHLFPLAAGAWQRLDGSGASPPVGQALAVASIAEPGSFLEMVGEQLGEGPEPCLFPDHHDYTPEDVGRIADRAGARWLVTTEKDAVKLEAFGELLPRARVLPLVPASPSGLVERLLGPLGGQQRPDPSELRRSSTRR